jgi:hypothetical protein
MRLEVLREALSNLLRQRDEWEDGYLTFQLVVEGADPSLLATERGISQAYW